MEFNHFQKSLIINYILGSIIAVCLVGSTFIFSTLQLSGKEYFLLVCTLIVSIVIMFGMEFIVFRSHIFPIKAIYQAENPTLDELEQAFIRAHHFPVLTFKRIMLPHFLGLAVPSSLITSIFIHSGQLSLPYSYIGLAWIGALLIAFMHGMIEFFLTAKNVRHIISSINQKALALYNENLSLKGNVIISIRMKFFISALFIGVFPILLFGLANQVRLVQLDTVFIVEYWKWAGVIIVLAIIFSIIGSFLLTQEIQRPIDQMIQGMHTVQNGELNEVSDFYSDEFSELVSGFNHMVASIKHRDEMNSDLVDSFFTVFAATLDARDPYTAGHSIRVANYAVEIGKKYGLQTHELGLLKKSALLHDIGKIGIRDEVLLKDGKLSDIEFDIIKQHPTIGTNILEEIKPQDVMQAFIPGVRYHHERFDGKGYPDQLKGEEIPLFGRILAVADAFDAMTSNRPYRNKMPIEKAMNIIENGKGSQWDPLLAQHFLDWMEENKSEMEVESS
ncbi:HD domain-containing phosphohydrolase [Radiobacillus sp. PE A8.2]|uniref:HD domain-containing phosphohydrolase n=1 Tax=Radiobacillus sp. PE A8.2 TaxID=3380349 RepID=UPI00388DE3A2